MKTSDQSARDRFATELDRNFSVVASAGSGKTTAITNRILSIAQNANATELLPRLVVVTFANRAADEMQQRARQLLLQKNPREEIQTAFNRAFFGTIHSFCLKLLTDYGHFLGLPAPLEVLTDDEQLWREFVQSRTHIGHSLGQKERAELFRLVPVRHLMELARGAEAAVLCPPPLTPRPPFHFDEIHQAKDAGKYNTVAQSQAELRDWEQRYASDWEFLRWPICFSNKGKFYDLWREKFAPLRRWICGLALHVAAEVQRDYRDFRLERGLVTYPDQIALARELFEYPEAARRIREENQRIILDEAQDTEPAQFEVLLETTRPASAIGCWMETRIDPPQPGHFCMVGDFQQSIYRDRADLPYYRGVHEALVADAHGESLTFSVTFRLDQKQLDFVNATFREILNEEHGQVRFVELHPRPNILPGKVIRVPVAPPDPLPEEKKWKDYQKARFEAEHVAAWLKRAGPQKLGADSWREVAILCPRKAWLQTMAAALRREQLPVAIQSEREVKGDSPAYAWLTALLVIMTDPRNAFEIVGVLREIFGVSDHDLALFAEREGARFRIDQPLAARGQVGTPLQELAEVRQRVDGLALFDAVTQIVQETQLRERLLLLPVDEFGDLARELDVLLAQAAEAEASGLILAEFAERLRNDFETPRSVRFAADENAIQLITSHKAKGLEWQCVVLPFFAREIYTPHPRYPHFVKSPEDGALQVALGKEDKSGEWKTEMERAQAHELERLLYVATTRARRTLVLVLDQEIFQNRKDQKLPTHAQLRRLVRGQDSYAGEFDAHSELLADSDLEEVVAVPESTPAKTEPIPAQTERRAVQRAADFISKITPSAFGTEPLEEAARVRARLDNQATLYGSWWHSLMQCIDWREQPRAWEPLFQSLLPRASDPERAAAEWDLLRQHLASSQTFRKHFGNSEISARAEVPFLLNIQGKAALEGIIDLVLFDDAGRALIVDWKTNRVAKGQATALREKYRSQLAAYWKALTDITGLQAAAGLYSTSTGGFLLYPEGELASEWKRLEGVPASRLAAAVEPPTD